MPTAETCESLAQSSRSRANPAGSRAWLMHPVRAPPRITAAANQDGEGRTTSAQIATCSAPHKACPPPVAVPAAGAQPPGGDLARHRLPAASAPLAIHRSCQLRPG